MYDYDKYIVAFSGGKDSTACFLGLLELGIPKDKIELWHHEVDGREGPKFMDWPITTDYCRKFAEAFGVPIYFSWKVGGFKREMLRENSLTAPTRWENPDGSIGEAGGKSGKPSTRRKFPQTSADLRVRWCSAYLKIDVMAMAINNQPRFKGIRTVVITGERAEESKARSKYKVLESHRTDTRNGRSNRYVDHWRPILNFTEREVWHLIEAYGVHVHPAYYLGYGRVSCMYCIFLTADQFATSAMLDPIRANELANYEQDFGVTLKSTKSLPELYEKGTPYSAANDWRYERELAMREEYDQPILLENWTLPAGAYGESCGPT